MRAIGQDGPHDIGWVLASDSEQSQYTVYGRGTRHLYTAQRGRLDVVCMFATLFRCRPGPTTQRSLGFRPTFASKPTLGVPPSTGSGTLGVTSCWFELSFREERP